MRKFYLTMTLLALLPAFLFAKTVHVYLLGVGVVGGTLLEQIHTHQKKILQEQGVEIRVVGIANSKKSCFDAAGIALSTWRERLDQAEEPMSWESYMKCMLSANLENAVFVDCSSNQAIADSYTTLLQAKISVVTPNKKANSSAYDTFTKLQKAANHAHFFYDANVGAGLPIIHTVKSMQMTGDQIQKIEGIFSGTISYLFNTFKSDMSFSELVKEAQKMGYTEPDPRDDLNGMDFARKVLILARESGLALELADIEIEPLLPEECFQARTVAEFYEKLQACDNAFSAKIQAAESEKKRLRYIALLENGTAKISLQAVGADHPFYSLSGTDNIIAINSNVYCNNPLVIKGPGAGASVTAAKVFEGIVRVGLAP